MADTVPVSLNQKGGLAEYSEDFTAAGSSDPIILQRTDDGVLVQITGTATAIEAVVERSTEDPAGTPNWAPAETTPITGDLTAGIAPRRYLEPARAYWRVRFVTVTGGSLKLYMVGGRA